MHVATPEELFLEQNSLLCVKKFWSWAIWLDHWETPTAFLLAEVERPLVGTFFPAAVSKSRSFRKRTITFRLMLITWNLNNNCMDNSTTGCAHSPLTSHRQVVSRGSYLLCLSCHVIYERDIILYINKTFASNFMRPILNNIGTGTHYILIYAYMAHYGE